jgi:thiamine-monophosphate kinase
MAPPADKCGRVVRLRTYRVAGEEEVPVEIDQTSGGQSTVGERGEFGLIADVVGRLTRGDGVLLGPGDDAAVVAAPDGRVVATTDVLVEGRHFRRDWSSATDIGHKAAAQSLADVAAMGAVPTALLVGLGTPADLPIAWVLELADGLREESALVGASVVGGDVVRSEAVLIAVTALGALEGRDPVTRSGARPGDLVAVAGRLGWAAGGLAVLQRGFRMPRVLVEAHRRPVPPYSLGPLAARSGATSMCDVSDGLLADLGHVAVASAVAVDLDPAAFTVTPQLRDAGAALGVDPLEWVLGGGEDHALVATYPGGGVLPEGFVVVGRVLETGAAQPGTVLVGGAAWAGPRGHTHFG